MANLNKVLLIGRLTADPELRYIPNGTAVSDVRMAVNERYKAANGEWQERPVYVTVTVWGRQAEIVAEHLKKGKQVFFEGRLKFDSWETPDGQKRSKLSVVAESMQFIDPKSQGGSSSHPPVDTANDDVDVVPDDTPPF